MNLSLFVVSSDQRSASLGSAVTQDGRSAFLGSLGCGIGGPIVHHYDFTIYALDTDRLDVEGDFTAADTLAAMNGHILDEATLTGTYTIRNLSP